MTFAGPFYGPIDTATRETARSAGLQLISSVRCLSKSHTDPGAPTWSPERVARDVLAEVHREADDPIVAAWYILPDELRFYRPEEMHLLKEVSAAIRENDPHGRPILHYQPNGRTREQLAGVVEMLDWAAVGAYANHTGHAHERVFVRWATEELVSACTSAGRRVTPFAAVEMNRQPFSAQLRMIARWVRHDVFAALVAGARGLLIYSGWPRQGFAAYEDYLRAYLDVLDELNGAESLAEPLMFGRSASPRYSLVLGFATTTLTLGARSRVPSVGARAVEYRGETWTFFVNSSPDRVVLELGSPSEGALWWHRRAWVRAPRLLPLQALDIAVVRHG